MVADLNEKQREAVLATEGPVLVLAGAGTGKTRVITYRVAHLIEMGVPPGAILAVTFTNKAAGVMKDRIGGACCARPAATASGIWVSTFHSFCARLLRREFRHLGLPRDFAIYDDDDQNAAVKRAMLQLGLSTEDYPPRSVRSQISHAKNHGITPKIWNPMRRGRTTATARMWRRFSAHMRKSCTRLRRVDFDDLLLRAVQLLREHADARARGARDSNI